MFPGIYKCSKENSKISDGSQIFPRDLETLQVCIILKFSQESLKVFRVLHIIKWSSKCSQGSWNVPRDLQKIPYISQCSKRYIIVPSDLQKLSEISRCSQGYENTPKGSWIEPRDLPRISKYCQWSPKTPSIFKFSRGSLKVPTVLHMFPVDLQIFPRFFKYSQGPPDLPMGIQGCLRVLPGISRCC